MRMFPMFLKLKGRGCLVVGGGPISEGKVEELLWTGARITVVAPEVTRRIAAWQRAGKLQWKKRAYQAADLAGKFLVVAATSSNQTHRNIYRDAERLGVLCNIVDVPELCDFYYPAVVQRGDLQIAISTAGASPSLAKRLRVQLEREIGPEYAAWLKKLAKQRQAIRKRKLPARRKMKMLEAEASEAAFLRFKGKRRGSKRIRK